MGFLVSWTFTVVIPVAVFWMVIGVLSGSYDDGKIGVWGSIWRLGIFMVVFGLYVWFVFPVVGSPVPV